MNREKQTFYSLFSIITRVVLAFSLLPIALISWFDYPTGDDLGYSAGLRQLMLHGGSWLEGLKLICEEVRGSWYSWQGTWSSLFLFHLQPGIWGGRAYALTPWIAVGCIMIGSWVLMKTVLAEELGISRKVVAVLYSAAMILSIQYIPKMRGGIFWYTSIAHYIIPYGLALLSFAWSIRFLRTSKLRYFAGCFLVMTYLGGAGYPEIILSFMWFVLLIISEAVGLTSLCEERDSQGVVIRHKNRYMLLFLPVIAELIGFVVSAAAPGNKVRGGEDFSLSITNVIYTLKETLLQGMTGIFRSFIDCRLLLPFFLAVVLFVWETYSPRGVFKKLRAPWFFLVCSFLVSCGVRAPEIYAGVDVSGGVPDTYFLTEICMITLGLGYAVCALKTEYLMRIHGNRTAAGGNRDQELQDLLCADKKREKVLRSIRYGFIAVSLVYCVLFRREIILPTVDYTCYMFAASGQLADFEDQMQERLAILENEEIKDVILPEMNSEQGPFMHMSLMPDPDAFTNDATARYYGKDSVIVVPRDVFYEQYSSMME